ncbi:MULTISPECIES: transaldolase family protein, partial [unclassified Frankia]|uniref:transaldolase family protein n=1 Tax=unclassified Frankia TaxID=2632575 RepID=UPI0027DB7011
MSAPADRVGRHRPRHPAAVHHRGVRKPARRRPRCPPRRPPRRLRADHDPQSQLSEHGVSVWLDDLSRELLAGGELQHLIEDRHVVGVTTNPTIFASALAKGDRYTDQLRGLADAHATVDDAIFQITTDDVRTACDAFLPTFQATGGVDGRVSIEVDPRLARDTTATITAARTLSDAVDRTNILVKIPATEQGLPAITATLFGLPVGPTNGSHVVVADLDRARTAQDSHRLRERHRG